MQNLSIICSIYVDKYVNEVGQMDIYSEDGDLKYRVEKTTIGPFAALLATGAMLSAVPLVLGVAGTVWVYKRIKRVLK